MAAVGFGLQKDAFTSLMKQVTFLYSISFFNLFKINAWLPLNLGCFTFYFQGPHLLAPTGSDLKRHGQIDTVFAGYHYDLNFLTIHGRSRFPGLNIWLRNGQKMEVKVPVGCLLIQTGKQVISLACLIINTYVIGCYENHNTSCNYICYYWGWKLATMIKVW